MNSMCTMKYTEKFARHVKVGCCALNVVNPMPEMDAHSGMLRFLITMESWLWSNHVRFAQDGYGEFTKSEVMMQRDRSRLTHGCSDQ